MKAHNPNPESAARDTEADILRHALAKMSQHAERMLERVAELELIVQDKDRRIAELTELAVRP